jgi:cytochrome P450
MSYTYPAGERVSNLETIKLVLSGVKFDNLAYPRQMAEKYGGFTYSTFGPISFYVISDPDIMHEVLVERADLFHKGELLKNAFRPFLGNGLLISEGDFWKRQRKLAQPAFHMKRIDAYGKAMVEYTERMVDSWRMGEVIWLDREMMKLTLQIIARTMFDADVSNDAEHVGQLLTEILEATNNRINAVFRLPEWIPTPQRARVNRSVAELDAILQRIIDERRTAHEDKGDLLSMLLLAQDDDGSGMTDRQLRDELMTIFLAGHETTAMALSWAWYLLSLHPDVMNKLQAEVDTALDGRAPTVADLSHLPYTEMIVKETMRLYPPAPGFSREPIQDIELAGYTVPKGSLFLMSSYAMHHNPQYFPEPEQFIPERFTPENEQARHKYAYLPFGGGPRVCIGNNFALMEARLVLAAMAQRVELGLTPGQVVEPQQLVTLRPKRSIQMKVANRQSPGISHQPSAIDHKMPVTPS